MSRIQEFTELLTNMSNMYENLEEKYNELTQQNKILEEKLKICNDMYSDLNKVSYVRSLSLELQNKNNIIKHLESQIEKQKINKIAENDIEKDLDKTKILEEEFKNYIFNIDEYEEIDQYELIKYKSVYYLKDTNNNIFSILNNKPYLLVGTINSKGKVVLA